MAREISILCTVERERWPEATACLAGRIRWRGMDAAIRTRSYSGSGSARVVNEAVLGIYNRPTKDLVFVGFNTRAGFSDCSDSAAPVAGRGALAAIIKG